jgi:transposase
MQISTIGIDLAKTVFQVHGVDSAGKVVIARQLRRPKMIEFFANLAPCLIGMEACATAHHWARELRKLGHEVKLRARSRGLDRPRAAPELRWRQRKARRNIETR